MKLSLFRKVCLTVMGVGVISSLVSVGTFATFTATTTNPSNTFAAGTLKISTSSNAAAYATNSNLTATSPNLTNTNGDFGTGTTCTKTIASACGAILVTNNVTTEGIEPGQYVKGHITITNDGTLPAIVSMNVQQVFTSAAAAGSTTAAQCPTDQTCSKLGDALNITIHDDTKNQCLFGSNGGTASPATTTSFAVSGACDDIVTGATNGIKLAPLAAQTPTDNFGSSAVAGTFFNLSGTPGTAIYVPGSDTHTTTINTGPLSYWAPAESHTFTVTIALPDQGTTTATLSGGNSGTDTITKGADLVYEGGSAGFDLVWLAQQ